MPKNVMFISEKKFMWDGVDYANGDITLETMKKYKADGFDVELCEEDGKNYLYTRRVVTQTTPPQA
jgi:hypothetical protein